MFPDMAVFRSMITRWELYIRRRKRPYNTATSHVWKFELTPEGSKWFFHLSFLWYGNSNLQGAVGILVMFPCMSEVGPDRNMKLLSNRCLLSICWTIDLKNLQNAMTVGGTKEVKHGVTKYVLVSWYYSPIANILLSALSRHHVKKDLRSAQTDQPIRPFLLRLSLTG